MNNLKIEYEAEVERLIDLDNTLGIDLTDSLWTWFEIKIKEKDERIESLAKSLEIWIDSCQKEKNKTTSMANEELKQEITQLKQRNEELEKSFDAINKNSAVALVKYSEEVLTLKQQLKESESKIKNMIIVENNLKQINDDIFSEKDKEISSLKQQLKDNTKKVCDEILETISITTYDGNAFTRDRQINEIIERIKKESL
jgi:DNA repair exonuclease SbcCD ATPase subunit